jgi:hypothetical protein
MVMKFRALIVSEKKDRNCVHRSAANTSASLLLLLFVFDRSSFQLQFKNQLISFSISLFSLSFQNKRRDSETLQSPLLSGDEKSLPLSLASGDKLGNIFIWDVLNATVRSSVQGEIGTWSQFFPSNHLL